MMGKSKKLRRLLKSAKMGKSPAQYQLALWYQTGHEVSQDMQEAAVWMSLAADSGYSSAKEWLSDYYYDDNADVQAKA